MDLIWDLLTFHLAIDLGTANTLVFVEGKGIVINEASVVARNRKKKIILAIGNEAKLMIGKTPDSIEAFRPLKNGVIADFDATAAMLKFYINKIHSLFGRFPKIPKPKVVIGIPSAVTEVERRAVAEAAIAAGARKVYLIEEPIAAAIGANLNIQDARGCFIVDIGGGTSEIALISLGGIVLNHSLRVAGDEMDEAIISFARLKYSLLIGLPTAEHVKITIGSIYPEKKEKTIVVRGRDLESGLPKSVKFSSAEIREAIAPVVYQIINVISQTIEEAPPELIGDLMKSGITLAGGGALLSGIDKIITSEIKMPVWIADDPMTTVVRGCAKLLQDNRLLEKVRVTGGLG